MSMQLLALSGKLEAGRRGVVVLSLRDPECVLLPLPDTRARPPVPRPRLGYYADAGTLDYMFALA